mmetsp:Transcript_55278/g.140184  ORF Transcript_55278/g.140184 Transcript_55278/m.140184 type:complete len:284 (+) Transcript_55278:95-946(+)
MCPWSVALGLLVALVAVARLLLRRSASFGIKVIVIRHASELGLQRKAALASTPLLQSVLKDRCILIEAPKSEVLSPCDVLDLKEAASRASMVLLFPSSGSASLDVLNDELRALDPDDGTSRLARTTLVVVDGSWKTVTSLISKNEVLQPQSIRHVHLSPETAGVSAYMKNGLRTEPRRGFVSTAEAVALALRVLRGGGGGSDKASEIILERFGTFAQSTAEVAQESASAKTLSAMAMRKRQCDDDCSTGGGLNEAASFRGREWALLDVEKRPKTMKRTIKKKI